MTKSFQELCNYVESLPAAKKSDTRICRDVQITADDALYLLGIEIPKDAAETFWLKSPPHAASGKRNGANRPYRVGEAKRIGLAILDGEYELTGETAIISDKCSVLDSQHRLGGLLWAMHWWSKAKEAGTLDEKYPRWADRIPFIEIYIVAGILDQGRLANKIDTGKSRSISDVVYRDYSFSDKYETKDRAQLAKIVSPTARLVWGRMNGKTIRSTPKMDQREAMTFVYHHPGIVAMTEYLYDLDKNPEDPGCVSRLVPMAALGGLAYLMMTARTKPGMGRTNPEEVDYSLTANTKTFINSLIKGVDLQDGNPILVLRNILINLKGAHSYDERQLRVKYIINAFNLWIDGKRSGIRLEDLRPEPGDEPRLGGLDVAD